MGQLNKQDKQKPTEETIEALKEETRTLVKKIKKIENVDWDATKLIPKSIMHTIRAIQQEYTTILMQDEQHGEAFSLLKFQWTKFMYVITSTLKNVLLKAHRSLIELEASFEEMMQQHPEEQKRSKDGQLQNVSLKHHLSFKKWDTQMNAQKQTLSLFIDEFTDFCRKQVAIYRSLTRGKLKNNKQYEAALRMRITMVLYMGDLCRYVAKVHVYREKLMKKWFDKAMQHYRCVTLLDPSSGFAFNQIGLIHMQLTNYAEAMFYFTRAMASTQSYSAAAKNRLTAIRQLSKKEKAGSIFDRFLANYLLATSFDESIVEEILDKPIQKLKKDQGRHELLLLLHVVFTTPQDAPAIPFLLRICCKYGQAFCETKDLDLMCVLVAFMIQPSIFKLFDDHCSRISNEYALFMRSLIQYANAHFKKSSSKSLRFYRSDAFFLGFHPLSSIYSFDTSMALPRKRSLTSMLQSRLFCLMKQASLLNNAHLGLTPTYFEVTPRVRYILFNSKSMEKFKPTLEPVEENIIKWDSNSMWNTDIPSFSLFQAPDPPATSLFLDSKIDYFSQGAPSPSSSENPFELMNSSHTESFETNMFPSSSSSLDLPKLQEEQFNDLLNSINE